MSTRQIKDAKDLSTNKLIYFKGHAKATYMSDGTTVEDAINNIGVGGEGSSDANVQAIEYDGSELMDERLVRDAIDLSTGEKIFFTGHAKYITTTGGSLLEDELDTIRESVSSFFYRWNVESVEYTEAEIPIEVAECLAAGKLTIVLNGGIAQLDPENGIIYSSTTKDGIIIETKVYLIDYASYYRITVETYSNGGVTQDYVDNAIASAITTTLNTAV